MSKALRLSIDKKMYLIKEFPFFDPYIVVNGHITAPVLFLFPPSFGGAEAYLSNICASIKNIRLIVFNNLAIYLQQIWTKDKFKRIVNMEFLAYKYIEIMRPLNIGNTSYILFGWSFGGRIAFEVANQLNQGKFCIKYIFMLDTRFQTFHSGLSGLSDVCGKKINPIINSLNLKVILFKAKNFCVSLAEKLALYLDKHEPLELVRRDLVILGFCLNEPALIEYFEVFKKIQNDNIELIDHDILRKLIHNTMFKNMFLIYNELNYMVTHSPYNGLDKYMSQSQIIVKKINASHLDVMKKKDEVKYISNMIHQYCNVTLS